MQDQVDKLVAERVAVLNFFKTIFPVFHNSNVFFRDFQYAIQRYLELKSVKVSYAQSEVIANELANQFEQEGIFTRVNPIGWRVNYELFRTGVSHTLEVNKTV